MPNCGSYFTTDTFSAMAESLEVEEGICIEEKYQNLTSWPGPLNFSASFPMISGNKAIYSDNLEKLFIKPNSAAYITFSVNTSIVAVSHLSAFELKIAAVVVFTDSSHRHHQAVVCPTHARDKEGKLIGENADRLLRLTEPKTVQYSIDKHSKMHRVCCDISDKIQQQECKIVLGFKLMDLGDCPGGINRRKTAIVFTLETDRILLGRLVLPFSLTLLPKRLMEIEEKRGNILKKPPSRGKEDTGHQDAPEDADFWILARGKHNFEALLTIGRILEESRTDGQKRDMILYNEKITRKNSHLKNM